MTKRKKRVNPLDRLTQLDQAANAILDNLLIIPDEELWAAIQRGFHAWPSRPRNMSAERIKSTLQELLNELARAIGAGVAALGLGTSLNEPFSPWFFYGGFPRALGTLAIVGQGQVVRVRNIQEHPAFQGFPKHHPLVTSLLGVPIRHRGKYFGNIFLGNKIGAEEFSEEDEKIARIFSSHVALLLQQVYLTSALELQEQQRRELIAMIAHDLRNPIHVLLMQNQILLRQARNKDFTGVEHITQQMRDSVSRLTRMTNELVDLSRAELHRFNLAFEKVAPGELIRKIVKHIQPTAPDQQIKLELPALLPEIQADPHRIEQVLANLIENAVKYSQNNSPIEIRAYPQQEDLLIEVKDHGPGVPKEEQKLIFTRFYQSKKRAKKIGLGLGLAISKDLVEAHGGTISLESEPGHGSLFRVRLPIAGAARKTAA